MYLNYFGLKCYPFQLTSDPDFIYYTEQHLEAINRLKFGFESNSGFIVLTGEVGSGKTTILRKFISDLNGKFAFIFNPRDDFLSLMRQIISEFDIKYKKNQDAIELIELLNDFCIDQLSKNERATIIIDEAQTLSLNVLEHIRLITNLETEKNKLLTIILSGQPELDEVIEKQELRQLKQRIGMRYCLLPMNYKDVDKYISYRLNKAGTDRLIDFKKSALKKIFFYSNGIPRIINLLSHHALITAFSEDRHEIDGNDIKNIADEFKLEKHKKIFFFSGVLIIELIILIIILSMVFYMKKEKNDQLIFANQCYYNYKNIAKKNNLKSVIKSSEIELSEKTVLKSVDKSPLITTTEIKNKKSDEVIIKKVNNIVKKKETAEKVIKRKKIPINIEKKVKKKPLPKKKEVLKNSISDKTDKKIDKKIISPSKVLKKNIKNTSKISRNIKKDELSSLFLRYWNHKFILSKNILRPAKYKIITGSMLKNVMVSDNKFTEKSGIYSLILDLSSKKDGKFPLKIKINNKSQRIDLLIDSVPPEIPEYDIIKRDKSFDIYFHMLPVKELFLYVDSKNIIGEYSLDKGAYIFHIDSIFTKKKRVGLEVIAIDEAGNEAEKRFILKQR